MVTPKKGAFDALPLNAEGPLRCPTRVPAWL